jgi:hypothetical protein
MPYTRRRIVLLLTLLALTGCTSLHQGKSPLLPSQMSPDSVVLDMFFVRFPFGDPTVNEKLWQEIDEQQFSPDLRERLARNGFRAGIISGQMPTELSKLMELGDKPAPTGQIEGTMMSDMDAPPRVVRRHLQIRAGQRSEIITSPVYPELTVLLSKPGQLSGQPYQQAQGIFAVKTFPQPDGRTRLELVPELHHDQPRPRWDVDNQGVWKLDSGRPRETYTDMSMAADLSPGAMLILSSLPNRPGSLGHHFFTDNEGRLEQRLLIVRLSQTQRDGLFEPPETLRLEE